MVGTEAAYHIPNRLGYFVPARWRLPSHRVMTRKFCNLLNSSNRSLGIASFLIPSQIALLVIEILWMS